MNKNGIPPSRESRMVGWLAQQTIVPIKQTLKGLKSMCRDEPVQTHQVLKTANTAVGAAWNLMICLTTVQGCRVFESVLASTLL